MRLDFNAVGSTIRAIRKERGLSQEVLSGLAGIARTHLTMIENASIRPSVDTIWKISQALNMRPSELFARIEAEIEHGSDSD